MSLLRQNDVAKSFRRYNDAITSSPLGGHFQSDYQSKIFDIEWRRFYFQLHTSCTHKSIHHRVVINLSSYLFIHYQGEQTLDTQKKELFSSYLVTCISVFLIVLSILCSFVNCVITLLWLWWNKNVYKKPMDTCISFVTSQLLSVWWASRIRIPSESFS